MTLKIENNITLITTYHFKHLKIYEYFYVSNIIKNIITHIYLAYASSALNSTCEIWSQKKKTHACENFKGRTAGWTFFDVHVTLFRRNSMCNARIN